MGTLIVVHELGHFLLAKLFGVGVDVFSVGFGRPLASVRWRGTEYRLSLLPLGGYVRMEGADAFQDGGDGLADPDSPTAFMNKPVWQRLFIVAAGPVFNLALPVVVFAALYMGGEPQIAAVVGNVRPGTPAAAAGLRPGDALVQVAGQPVELWGDLYPPLETVAPGQVLPLRVRRGEAELDLGVQVPADAGQDGEPLGTDELGFGYIWADTTIGVNDPISPAAKAGLRTFDRVLALNGQPIRTWEELSAGLEAAAAPVVLRVGRVVDGQPQELELTVAGSVAYLAPGDRPYPHQNRYGIYPAATFLYEIVADSAAEAGGLRPGDHLVAIDGRPLSSWRDVIDGVAQAQVGEGEAAKSRDLELTLIRDGVQLDRRILPRVQEDTDELGRYRYRAMLGIGPVGGGVTPYEARRYYSLAEAVPKAAEETWLLCSMVVEHLGRMLTLEVAPSRTLGGPIQIFRDASAAAEQGIFAWARMMGMLSISLGIINFVPVPVLDGGQFLFYLVEGVRGRPLSLAVRERALQIGVLFLVGLMLMVMVFDVNRWLGG